MSEQIEQVQESAPAIAAEVSEKPGWERWTQMGGVAFVALVVLGLVGLLGWGVLFKSDAQGLTRLNRPAPDFSLTTFDGDKFQLSAQKGKPVFVNFWASWCDACKEEAPVLEQAYRDYKDKVVFIGVDIQDKRPDALKFIDTYNVTYPNGQDEGSAYFDYGGTGVPESYFVNKDGNIVIKYIGALNKAQIEAFLAEAMR